MYVRVCVGHVCIYLVQPDYYFTAIKIVSEAYIDIIFIFAKNGRNKISNTFFLFETPIPNGIHNKTIVSFRTLHIQHITYQ